MNITDYLKDFFAENADRKAAVPGLGVFYTEKKADGRYRIMFEEVAPKGKAFINHVAFRMNATEQEVVGVMETWVKEILQSLKTIKVATLPGIGTFDVSDGKVNFLPSAEQDKEDGFGLERRPEVTRIAVDEQDDTLDENEEVSVEDEVFMKDEEDEIAEAEDQIGRHRSTIRKKHQSALLWGGIGGCILVLIVALVLVFQPFSSATDRETAVIEDIILGGNEGALSPEPTVADVMASVEAEKVCEDEAIAAAFMSGERDRRAAEAEARQQAAKPAAKPAPAPKPAAKPAPKPVAKPVAKPAAKQVPAPKPAAKLEQLPEGVVMPVVGRFYIVVGSYANIDNARRVYTQLTANEAFDVRVLFDAAKNIYKVSIKEFSDKASAIRFKNDLRSAVDMDGWIYEHK